MGNRLQSTSGVTVNWSYNQNNELQNYDGVTFQYDLNGNITNKANGTNPTNETIYVYDIENRLIRVEDGTGKVIAKYEYDPFGRRLWKEVEGQRTYFVYCGEGLAAELDNNGSLTKTYGWEPNSTWTTNPVFMREDEQYYFYHNDHLGTPQKITAVNGAIVWQAKYTDFGEAEINMASTITNNLRFPGQFFDKETALHYNYHRFYDARGGRYLTIDPIGFNGNDINLYCYVFDNPISWLDYSGLFNDGKKKKGGSEYGHSDFYGWDPRDFDWTREDTGWHYPVLPWAIWRHFRKKEDVMLDLEKDVDMCNLKNFRMHIHQGQDTSSHYDEGYRTWWIFEKPFYIYNLLFLDKKYWLPGHGAASLSFNPDDNYEAWQKANDCTMQMMKKWHEKCWKCYATEDYLNTLSLSELLHSEENKPCCN